MAVPDFEKALYANEEGTACVEGNAADGICEDRRGRCSTTPIVGLRAIYDGRERVYEGYCCCEILHADAVAGFPQRFILLKRSPKVDNDGLRAALYLHLLQANAAHVDC